MDDLFTKSRSISLPRKILAGHDVLPQLGDVCKEFELKSPALMVTGTTTAALAGKPVSDIMVGAGYEIQTIQVGEATQENVGQVVRLAKETKARFLLGVGGGNKIDIAKMAATELRIPYISIPTSASHDGIASPRASIHGFGNSVSVEAKVPLAIIVDTKIIVKAPFRLLASGCADVISNKSALLDWKLAQRLRGEVFSTSAATISDYAAESIISNASTIKPNLEESIWTAIKPIIISGIAMAIAGSSRPTSGAEHLFSHMLDTLAPKKALHGEQCGVGSIMMMYLHGGDWQRIRDSLSTIGAPVTGEQLGIERELIIQALCRAHEIRQDRYTVLGDRGLTHEAAERLAKITGVIS
ncbi:MAG: NAD(P)-dependent glycerol-1-phosphate dehydrogenase [Thermoplasmata archaeon]